MWMERRGEGSKEKREGKGKDQGSGGVLVHPDIYRTRGELKGCIKTPRRSDQVSKGRHEASEESTGRWSEMRTEL